MYSYKTIQIANELLRDEVDDPALFSSNGLTKIFYNSHNFVHSDHDFDCIIHFNQADTIQLYKGELLHYEIESNFKINCWIFQTFKSKLYKSRKEYIKKFYRSESFDYFHYLFKFHDYFIETISLPFEIEKTMGFSVSDFKQKESKQPDKFISPNPLEECHFYEYQNYQIPEVSNSDYFHKLYKCIYKPKLDTYSKTYSCYLTKIDNKVYSRIEPRPLGIECKTFSGVLSFSEFINYILSISLKYNDVNFSGTNIEQ